MSNLKQFKQDTKAHIARTLLHFENINLNQLQTRQLLATKTLHRAVDDVDATIVKNLLDTFDYIEQLDLSALTIDHDLFIDINHRLAKEQALFTGRYRDSLGRIGCIDKPIAIPDPEKINAILQALCDIHAKNYKSVVADAFMHLAKMQPFFDGNKRASLFLCNIALAKKELGYFSIPNEKYCQFEEYLTLFYRDNQPEKLKQLIENALIVGNNEG